MNPAERLTAAVFEEVRQTASLPCETVERGLKVCREELDDEADYCLPCAARAFVERNGIGEREAGR